MADRFATTYPDTAAVRGEAGPTLARRALRATWRFVRQKPLGAFGAFIVLVFIVTAVFAEQIAPYSATDQVLTDRLQGVSSDHIFGTDELGRDLFSRVVFGARTSVTIGFGALAISTVLATALGVISGYYGGPFDLVFQRLIDAWQAIPPLILIIAVAQTLGGDVFTVTLALGIVGGASSSRIMRAAALSAREQQYVEAARATGANDLRLVLRHVLPNVMYLIILTASLRIGAFILAESSLSFLGFGVEPPEPTWGQMLSGGSRNFMTYRPELALFPGLALTLVVFGFNVLGDALRDVTDPRLRQA